MKKFITFICLIVITVTFTSLPAAAAEESIDAIDINVQLFQDGTAEITETWDVKGIYDGTEYFIAMDNQDTKIKAGSFKVFDQDGNEFEYVSGWNSDDSLEEKANKNGIIETDEGIELCWGIGSYGDQTYVIKYTLQNLVKGYSDYDGFYHQFVSTSMSSPPKSVRVNINMDGIKFTDKNSTIQAEGYDGTFEFESDGSIVGYTEQEMREDNYIRVMCQFEKDLFTPTLSYSHSFDQVKQNAEKGESNFPSIIGLSITAAIIIFILAQVLHSQFMKLSDGSIVKIPTRKKAEICSELPFKGSLPASYYAMRKLRHKSISWQIFGSYLLKWHNEGNIRIENMSYDKKNTEDAIIVFKKSAESLPLEEKMLYSVLKSKADSNGILPLSALHKWVKSNTEKLKKWYETLEKTGIEILLADNKIAKNKNGRERFTPYGFECAEKMIGFWRFLEDISFIQYENNRESNIWGKYFEFAALFGIDEEFAVDLQKYNSVAADSYWSDYMSGLLAYWCIGHMVSLDMAQSLSDAGGVDSGGGFSGGGFSGATGGGSR